MPADDAIPELVFVPARPVVRNGVLDVILEIRKLADGILALPAFSTLDNLTAELGDCQPWAALPLRSVQQILSQAGAGVVALNPAIDGSAWQWREHDLTTLTGALPAIARRVNFRWHCAVPTHSRTSPSGG